MEIKASQIAALLNEIYDGVERSKCGKMVREEASTNAKLVIDGKPAEFVGILNQIPYQTYLVLVQNIVPKRFDTLTEIK